MTEAHLEKVKAFCKIHCSAADKSAEYWGNILQENPSHVEAKRFRACALEEYTAYSKILELLDSEERCDKYLSIWKD